LPLRLFWSLSARHWRYALRRCLGGMSDGTVTAIRDEEGRRNYREYRQACADKIRSKRWKYPPASIIDRLIAEQPHLPSLPRALLC
jgi:hypothetical protein